MVGAVAMVVVGGLPMDAALHAIDLHVLMLLFGVLMIAAYLQEAQFFRLARVPRADARAVRRARCCSGCVRRRRAVGVPRQRHRVRRADAARRRGRRRGAAAGAAVPARARVGGERRRRRQLRRQPAEHDRRGGRRRARLGFAQYLAAHAADRRRVPRGERAVADRWLFRFDLPRRRARRAHAAAAGDRQAR